MGKTTLRVVTMNLENLFDPEHEFYGHSHTSEEYNAKINWIGETIAASRAQVVGLTELGEDHERCLKDLLAATNKAICGKKKGPFQHSFAAEPAPSGAGIRTGVISWFPLEGGESIETFPDGFVVDLLQEGNDPSDRDCWLEVPIDSFSRPVTKVRVAPPGDKSIPFNMFVIHLKSKRPATAYHDGFNEAIGSARAAIRRTVEAAALRYYFDEFLPTQYSADPAVPTMVMGDFNATPTSVPFEIIRGSFDGVPGPASPWSEQDKKRLVSGARIHLKKCSYEDKLYSYIHNESFSLIDQILVSEHLVGKFKRMEIFNDHVMRHHELSSATDEEKQYKSKVSDHGVVVVELTRMLDPSDGEFSGWR